MSRRALITGAAGFVGKILAGHLEAQGWEVLCSDLRTPPGEKRWFPCDVSKRDQVEQLLEWGGAITHLFHLAAITFVPDTVQDPCHTFEVNLQGTVHLTTALWPRAPGARLVFVSSAEVYGYPQFLPITEAHPLNPANPYAISKAATDQYCAYLHRARGMDIVCMRPFNHTGPGQADLFVLSSFARQIALIESGQLPPVLRVGNLETLRDFLHVGDVVRAYELAALHGVSGEVYNVCSGRGVMIREALEQLLRLSAAAIRIETDPERMRPVDVPEMWGSHDKLTVHTGWRPEISFSRLLSELLEHWRSKERR